MENTETLNIDIINKDVLITVVHDQTGSSYGFQISIDIYEALRLHFTEDLERELKVTEDILKYREQLLDAIPECDIHGKCVSYALDWIEDMKKKVSE